jgi:hypothetical protein
LGLFWQYTHHDGIEYHRSEAVTALEIRLIAYALAGLALIGGSIWLGHIVTAHHYERIMAADKLAQDEALQAAQQKTIAAEAAQRAAESKAENEHALLVKADATSRDAVLGSVRSLEAALHLRGVPPAVGNPGAVPPGASIPAGDSRIAGLVERLDTSIERAIAACQHDSATLAYILSIQPKVIP